MSLPKRYFRMGEVCERTGLEPHVLRFWENEFAPLKPEKNRSGHRIFKQPDINLILHIKKLLYEEGFTISGAQKKLQDESTPPPQQTQIPGTAGKASTQATLKEVESILRNLINMLDS